MFFQIATLLFAYVVSNQILYPRLNIVIHSTETSRSHLRPLLEISEELSTRGHHVTLAARDDKLQHSEKYNVTRYSLGKPKPPNLDFYEQYATLLKENELTSKNKLKLLGWTRLFLDDYDNVLNELGKMINIKRPDLMICDFASGACSDLAQKYGIPLIFGIQTIDVFKALSIPFEIKTKGYDSTTYEKLSFLERGYYELIDPIINMNFIKTLKKRIDLKKAQYNINPKSNVIGDFDYGLVFANTYFGLEVPITLPPNVKLIGPLMSKFTSKLDTDLQQFMDNNSRTLYIGFGTVVIPSKQEISTIILACIKALENKVINGIIWGLPRTTQADFPKEIQINGDFISINSIFLNNHPNLRLLSWAPQEAILEHTNTVLYMNHGGLESLMESLYYVKPMLVMPFVGDQPRNAAKAELMGVGTFIDRHTMSKDSLLSEIIKWTNQNDMKIQFNLQRMKTITQRNSHRLTYAADIVEDHAYLAQTCRPLAPYTNEAHPPCEMTHLIPTSKFIPWYSSHDIGIYITLAVVIIVLGYTVSLILILILVSHQNEACRKIKQS